jgi:large subunit ribosomal protein L23
MNAQQLNNVIKSPVITEESTIQTGSRNQYIFRVSAKANKRQIRDAVEAKFNVKVLSVNTMNYRGKRRVRGRYTGFRPAWKKAVVTLRRGDAIDLLG